MAKVLLAMSGGIDSTVSAILLKEQGYEIVGATFRVYDSIRESCLKSEKGCCSIESIMEAKHMAETLGFEHHIVDLRETFRQCVIQNFIDEYKAGRTPNPCVLCNSTIKWGEMLKVADEYGCDYIATGHYAQIAEYKGHTYLKRAVDEKKDQTYFLWMLTEENLKRTIFPLGGLTKTRVREIAAEHGFVKLSQKTESQEICFVPDNDYRNFLKDNGIESVQGDYIKDGKVVGKHEGYPNYTIGQRKGLGIALGSPQFVTKIDAELNEVHLGNHDDLYTQTVQAANVRIRDMEWLQQDPEIEVRIRYRSQAVKGRVKNEKLKMKNEECGVSNTFHSSLFTFHLDAPVWGVTPGQSLVLYKDNLVIGGGVLK